MASGPFPAPSKLTRPVAGRCETAYFWRMKPRKKHRLPKLVRFLALHMFWGFTIGCAFVLALIHTDFLGVGSLLARDESGIATFLLFFQTSLTFGGVAMGVAVMNLAEDES